MILAGSADAYGMNRNHGFPLADGGHAHFHHVCDMGHQ
jgi:hypothetical protein